MDGSGIVAFRHAAERRVEELRMAVATMPLGITGAETHAIVGGSPDHVSQQSGVLVTPVFMPAATNSKAAAHGAAPAAEHSRWPRGQRFPIGCCFRQWPAWLEAHGKRIKSSRKDYLH
jgi:hypothetical protein